MTQFGNDDSSVRWKSAYGAFCSQHADAVSIYKDILKTDGRFQEFVQQCSNNPLLRKMGIPECILTVSTRITKYPLLIEPLIKTAKERPEEQQKLRNCLHLVKSILVDVNGQVGVSFMPMLWVSPHTDYNQQCSETNKKLQCLQDCYRKNDNIQTFNVTVQL